ncbi:MAG: tetratricopeptide repeat protein, partial [Gallionella sp.]
SGKKYKHCCEGKVAPRSAGPSPNEFNQLVTLYNTQRYAELESRARSLVGQYPGSGLTWKLLGASLQMQGKNALSAFQKTAALMPNDAEAHNNLGSKQRELGQFEDAAASLGRALQIKPNYAGVHYNLGMVMVGLRQLNKAVASYRLALEIKPDYADAHNNMGNALNDLGQFDDATESFRRALKIKPDFAEAHSNLGLALRNLGQNEGAMASYRRALELNPDLTEAHHRLGNILRDTGQLEGAVLSYRRVIEIKPDFAEVHIELGSILQDQDRLAEAEAIYSRALEIKPDLSEIHSRLGDVLRNSGQLDGALAVYRRAMDAQPHALQHTIHAHLLLPIIPGSLDDLTAWRERYRTGMAVLMDVPGFVEEPAIVKSSTFYLAYHNYNNRTVMETLCRLFRARVADLTTTEAYVSGWRSPKIRGQRIRVGFLSQFLSGHTIGKLYQGFIRQLDRSRFEVVVIHTPNTERDTLSQHLDALADKSLTLPASLKNQQQAVAAEKLDVLFYPDIGMSSFTYFLAYSRLAPVQAVSWGHPDTTGLDTMDYFVSAASIEPEDAEEHYTERLIRMNRIPCFYQPLVVPEQISTRASLGLPESGTLYGCPQSLFKFHPDFDAVLAAIAEGDPAGRIVLLVGKYSAWTDLLRARWAKTFPVLLERVLFLPRIPTERFMTLMANMDVLLDPIHFGSGNTLYEAMVYGTPIVTWPGKFMRGRIVAGAYRQMCIADAPVAPRLEDYAPLALALGCDSERRRALRQASLAAANRELFADLKAVREFEAFLEAAVAAAVNGQKLPAGWRPDIQPDAA